MAHSVLGSTKPSPWLLDLSWLKCEWLLVVLQKLGVQGLDLLGLCISDAESLEIQQSSSQAIHLLPARNASGIHSHIIIIIIIFNGLILKYMYMCMYV